jgi:hypothetical protein
MNIKNKIAWSLVLATEGVTATGVINGGQQWELLALYLEEQLWQWHYYSNSKWRKAN